MEDILASIRRIISDEEPAASAASAGASAEDDASGEAMSQDDLDKLFDSGGDADVEAMPDDIEAVETDDVFELTEDLAVEDEEDTSDKAMAAAMDMEEFDASDVAFVESEPEPAQAPRAAARPAPRADDDSLLSPVANRAVHAAFTNLAGTILSNNARTLEDLVKDLLRPMLKDWLDENLPSMVERMVRQEIERISRGR